MDSMRKQIKIRIQLHSYMRTKQITNSTYMKKQILLTNYYTMTTIKVTSESFYSITEDCLKRFTVISFRLRAFLFIDCLNIKHFKLQIVLQTKIKMMIDRFEA